MWDMQKLTPHLWFDTKAVEAANFYVNLFGNGSKVTHQSTMSGTPSGDVDVVSFELWGFRFDAISAGPYFAPNPSISFSVQCHDEAEIDRLHAALSEGGKILMDLDVYPWSKKYSWVNDRYGFSWQLNLPADDHDYGDRIALSLMYTKGMAGKAEEAMQLYTSVFPQSKIRAIHRYENGEPNAEGKVQHGEFELFGQTLMALDGYGPHDFVFSEAVSLLVRCDSQEEIDAYWEKLSAHPESEQCGWLKDAYGVCWQITPVQMDEMLSMGTPEQKKRVTEAFLQMKKFDIEKLKEAFEGA